jgi:hypothetical protein
MHLALHVHVLNTSATCTFVYDIRSICAQEYLQHLGYEIDDLCTQVGRDVKLARLDFLEQHGDIAIVKWESATQQGI